MANSILSQIANPVTANMPKAIQAGQQIADQGRLDPQKANLLQQQLLNATQSGSIAGAQESRAADKFTQEQEASNLKDLTYDIMSAFAIGPGDNRDSILKSAVEKATEGSAPKKVLQDLIDTPEGEVREQKFLKIIESAQQKGLIPPSRAKGGGGGKTPGQINEGLDIAKREVSVKERLASVKEKGLGKTEETKVSPWQRMLNERQALLDQGLTEDDFEVQSFNMKLLGTDANMANLTENDIDTIAGIYTLTGKMPPVGRGKSATVLRSKILKSAARQMQGGEEGAPERSPVDAALYMVGQGSDTKAIQVSLNFLDKQLSSMGSFVTNLNSQIDEVSKLVKDIETFDTRLLNVPLRTIRGRIKGSALQAKYDLYLSEIESEMGKLSSGSTASVAELSEGARIKWEKIHDKALSTTDMLSLLVETKKAANFRLQSVQDQLDATRQRMRRGKALPDSPSSTQDNDPLGLR